MRDADIERLASATRTSPFGDPEALEALGIPLPSLGRLEAVVLKDLSVGPPYGIWWWEDRIPTGHRIAISDQLYSCIQSISQNLIESQLHWLEFLDWMERANQLISVSYDSGEPILCRPSNRIALEFLTPRVKSMHEVSVIRSLCSSLDCVAGAIIAIAALDMNVLKADFLKVKNKLKKLNESRIDELNFTKKMQASLAKQFHEIIESSGPQGWVEWMLHYRNMVAHRGRRITFGQFIRINEGNSPDSSGIFRWINHLPIDPSRSDIEVLSSQESLGGSLLEEDSTTTIKGLIESTISLTESTSDILLRIWIERRKNPSETVQPRSQWGSTSQRVGFLGYRPKKYKVPRDDTRILANPVLAKRLHAASLDDGSRSKWKEFNADPRCLITE